jgi:hypothetical protein
MAWISSRILGTGLESGNLVLSRGSFAARQRNLEGKRGFSKSRAHKADIMQTTECRYEVGIRGTLGTARLSPLLRIGASSPSSGHK